MILYLGFPILPTRVTLGFAWTALGGSGKSLTGRGWGGPLRSLVDLDY